MRRQCRGRRAIEATRATLEIRALLEHLGLQAIPDPRDLKVHKVSKVTPEMSDHKEL